MIPDSLTLILALVCWGLALRSWAIHKLPRTTDPKETTQ